MQCNLEDLSNLWGNWYQLILTALPGIDFSLPGIIDSSLEYSDSTPVLDHQCKYSEYDLYENFWTSTCRRSWVVSPTTNRTYEYRNSVIHNCKIDTALSIEVLKNGASKGPFKNMEGILKKCRKSRIELYTVRNITYNPLMQWDPAYTCRYN